MKKRVLITGSNGLLGQKLVELLSQEPSIELIATAKGNNRLNVSSDYSYVSLDITQEEEVNQVFEEYQPNMVIHTAAMTNVDACETDPEGCEELNVTAVEYLIRASEKYNTFFVTYRRTLFLMAQMAPIRRMRKLTRFPFMGKVN